jgi:hypothetical protein
MKHQWIGLLLLTALAACEKKIDFVPQNLPPSLVVEGEIETGRYPVVILSKTVDYFGKISPQLLLSSFVRNAKVSVSNGSVTHLLKEYAFQLPNGYVYVYYTVDSTTTGTIFRGEIGKTYDLKIEVNNEVYTATTQIPTSQRRMDSIWWKPLTSFPTPRDTSRAIVMGRFTDPPLFGDYVQYKTSRNREPFFSGVNSVFDDQFVNGTTFDIQVDRGDDRNNPSDIDDYGYFEKGDTVTVKFSNITRETYNFYRTLDYSFRSIGNPFSQPTKVQSNISGNALGVWAGFKAQYRTIIIPK